MRPFIIANLRWIAAGFLLLFASSFGQTFFIALSGGAMRGFRPDRWRLWRAVHGGHPDRRAGAGLAGADRRPPGAPGG
ncbi:hypothetical protein ACFQ4K_33910 [Tistrella bauzanensis]